MLSDAGCLLRVAAISLFFSKIKEEKLGAPQLFAAARGRKGAIESGGKREMESRAKALSIYSGDVSSLQSPDVVGYRRDVSSLQYVSTLRCELQYQYLVSVYTDPPKVVRLRKSILSDHFRGVRR